MELHERLTTTRPSDPQGAREPFAELKTQVHLAVIGDLGPQLFNVTMDPAALRERVARRHPATPRRPRRRSRATTASA